jgi:membrane-bound ClpP family serine protease
MLKLLPILFLAVINTANVNIFEIEGIFSSGHINALERYVDQNSEEEKNLFVVQYNASDVNVNSIDKLQIILNNMDAPKAIWVGPNKREVDLSVLRNFDFVGLSPGTIITNNKVQGLLETICETNTCTNNDVLVTAEEGIYMDYLIVGSIGAFVENLGSQEVPSRIRQISMSFDLSSEEINQIRFIKPSLFERFYIAISNPVFTYLFFALGFALIGLELFAIGPGLMAFNGSLLIAFSSMTFQEHNLNYIGLLIFLVSFLMFIKVLSRGFFGPLGVAALIVMHGSSLVMFSDYLLQINHFLLFGSSLLIAFFYFVAIPTVIRSRLTTDTSAMSSLVNSQVILLELINNNQALVKLNGKKIVVDRVESNSYTIKNEYKLVEEDGKLII